jgi:hypothetical protein
MWIITSWAADPRKATEVSQGQANIADPVHTLNFLFSGGDAPPAPHPVCGIDLTEDAVDCQNYMCPPRPPILSLRPRVVVGVRSLETREKLRCAEEEEV